MEILHKVKKDTLIRSTKERELIKCETEIQSQRSFVDLKGSGTVRSQNKTGHITTRTVYACLFYNKTLCPIKLQNIHQTGLNAYQTVCK